MKKDIQFRKTSKGVPLLALILGVALFAAVFILRLNAVAVIAVGFMCVVSAINVLSVIVKKEVHLFTLLGYAIAGLAVSLYYIIFGADAGFGAWSTCLAGWKSAENTLFASSGNFFTRLCGNLLLILPCIITVLLLLAVAKKNCTKAARKRVLALVCSIAITATSVLYLLTMNLRSVPNTKRLWEGQDEYLKKIDHAAENSPNVLVILMDDLGWGDVSLNGAIYDTPNIDSIGEMGLNFDNFYSGYSVCSPARFALLTGRYPYRGYADNVIYPTIQSSNQFCATRLFNSFEMGANTDGMLGDEITIAEVFQAAGYNTGAFGKWHLGDYGEYLPTNQGFDYFYGSHHVNDMTPFYHVAEENGEYEIAVGYDELKDQSKATALIHEEISDWITDKVQNSNEPFFAYYASPWPHAPVYAGDDFDGKTGMGTYADCVTEFDTYLGKLFATLEELGVMNDTLIVFTSDNGPALEGSTDTLRGGKYTAYDGGQKVPFMIRWGNNGGIWSAGDTRIQSATFVDLFPTLLELCGIGDMPTDRETDGVSMLDLLRTDEVLHTSQNPILHMKREKIKAIQYAVPITQIEKQYPDYDYDILNSDYLTFKYFRNIQNDNSAFFDKYRKNWLHILNDDIGENYNRSSTYPNIAEEMNARMTEITNAFKTNRRGIVS